MVAVARLASALSVALRLRLRAPRGGAAALPGDGAAALLSNGASAALPGAPRRASSSSASSSSSSSSWAKAPPLPPGAVATQALSAVPKPLKAAPKEECGTAPAADDDLGDDVPMVDPRTKEWGGPTKGGSAPEPTRFGDWERKGRCTDFS